MKQGKYRSHLQPGDKVEIEVVFGKQPNVVKYSEDGTNYIVLLRPVDGTDQKRFDKLADSLNGKEITVQSRTIDTIDGETLIRTTSPFKWKIVKNVSERVSSELISHSTVMKLVSDLELFLKEKNQVLSKMQNREVSNFSALTFRLVGLKAIQQIRDSIKQEKDRLNQEILTKFKLPIKKKLFSDLIDNGQFLSAAFKDKEKTDLEGFVLSDGENQIKIVDRDLFTAINQFNFKIRNELNGAVMSDDMEAPLINKGGVFGNCKLRIANLFDVSDLARSAKAKKIFNSYAGKTPEETAKNFTKSLKITDFGMYQTKIAAILTDTNKDLTDRLAIFKQESNDYKVELKNGVSIPYSEESKKRTLLAFAELKKEIDKLLKHIHHAKSTEDLILALYGKLISEAAANEVKESETKNGEIMSEGLTLLKTLNKLVEDDGGEGSVAPPAADAPSPTNGATVASAIAPVPARIFNGKVVRRMKRNYFPKKKKQDK
jgi:hypothetical protein